MKPVIFGMSGLELTAEEKSFFADADPAGYIIFGRNIDNRPQLRALTDSIRELHGRNVPILIDQEGGRVARMKEPEWPPYPSGAAFDALYKIAPISAIEAMRLNAQAIAFDLHEVGINVNCAPLLDVRQDNTVDAIGDRALGYDPMQVAALGKATIEGFEQCGVAAIIKHIPGHGRATIDSHMDLPHVHASLEELEQDIEPFATLSQSTMAMTAHIIYEAWDKERCATMSPLIIENIIRKKIGFDGLLFSDDLDMKALKGDKPQRAIDVVAAGCDIALNCWGRMPEMIEICQKLDDISDISKSRLDKAMQAIDENPKSIDYEAVIAKRDQLLAQVV